MKQNEDWRGWRSRQSAYPNLDKWIRENCKSYGEFADMLGCHRTTLYKLLDGVDNLSLYRIQAILDITGMTFETCFQEGRVQRVYRRSDQRL